VSGIPRLEFGSTDELKGAFSLFLALCGTAIFYFFQFFYFFLSRCGRRSPNRRCQNRKDDVVVTAAGTPFDIDSECLLNKNQKDARLQNLNRKEPFRHGRTLAKLLKVP
jgi:hypothetical protein